MPNSSSREAPEIRVDLLGRADESTAYAMVNRSWLRSLGDTFQLRQHDSVDTLDGVADALIWSDWERPFEDYAPPPVAANSPAIAVRPWDFGPYPRVWVDRIHQHFRALCVHSNWLREKAIEGGVDADQVAVVPLGVDRDAFCAEGDTHPLADPSWFTFLYVGASVRRKGLDVLLSAFRQEFAPDEGVRLVVKDRPVDVFYGGLDLTADLQELEPHVKSGALVLLREHLSAPDLAGLMRGCDVAVFPYRAEGFALPILEALSCGTPVVVPRFGACLDFCSEASSFFAPHRRIRLPVARAMPYNSLGFSVPVEEVDFCEVSTDGLRSVLREIADAGRDALHAKREAAARVAEAFSWTASAHRLGELVERVV